VGARTTSYKRKTPSGFKQAYKQFADIAYTKYSLLALFEIELRILTLHL
jgi:hypothetical protein